MALQYVKKFYSQFILVKILENMHIRDAFHATTSGSHNWLKCLSKVQFIFEKFFHNKRINF